MEQEELLIKIAGILEKLNIPYAVTGGIAVSVWGRARFTADIDIAVELFPEKLKDLASELLKIDKDVYVDELSMQRALEKKGEFNFIHHASGLKVDFWVLKGTSFDKKEVERKISREFSGTSVSFISPEDLILRKLLWYKMTESDRQLEDIKSVLERQKKLDIKYISYRQCLMIIFAIFLVVPSMIFGIGEWTYFYYFFPPIGFLGIIVLAILGIDKSKSKRMAFVIFGVLLLILLAAFIMYLLDKII